MDPRACRSFAFGRALHSYRAGAVDYRRRRFRGLVRCVGCSCAFLAGMVVAQSPLSHQAAADALPLRDAFSVLFFVSVGMLFRPSFVVEQPLMVVAGVGIVLIIKPIAALAIVAALGYPARTALTVAIGLAQIGEFSFILAQAAQGKGLMPDEGVNVLVAAAIISITLNPLLFRSLDRIEARCRRWPLVWKLLNARADKRIAAMNSQGSARLAAESQANGADTESNPAVPAPTRAIVVGYGPVGRLVDALLRDANVRTTVVDMNVDTVKTLADEGRTALYGDASRREVLDQAGIATASHLIVTLPSAESRTTLVMAARELNATAEITVRARYLAEREGLLAAGASTVICEEGEAGVALAKHVMERRGLDAATTDKLLSAVRQLWKLKR
ncbi:MAG: NAD-binding protein [Phycisphaerales bacterium]